MSRRALFLIILLAVIAGGAFLILSRAPAPGPDIPTQRDAQVQDVDPAVVPDMTLGNPEAPVTVVEYASFTCPHCRNFHEQVFKQLRANYIDNGKIHFIYREVYFDRYGLWAAIVARCAGPEKYFGMADLIYRGQSEWTAGGDPATIADNLRKLGRTAGLSNEQLDACLEDADMANAMVAAFQAHAEKDGINSTPTFIINGEKFSNMSYAEFSAILDEKLGE